MFKNFCCKFCILQGAIWRHNSRYNPQHKCSKTRGGGGKGRLNIVKKQTIWYRRRSLNSSSIISSKSSSPGPTCPEWGLVSVTSPTTTMLQTMMMLTMMLPLITLPPRKQQRNMQLEVKCFRIFLKKRRYSKKYSLAPPPLPLHLRSVSFCFSRLVPRCHQHCASKQEPGSLQN